MNMHLTSSRSPFIQDIHLIFSLFQILLNELGFDEDFITPLREHYLRPLTSLLYPDCGGRCLDSHKAFVVKYDMKEDLDLSYHYDNAEVTLNVSLGKDFTEGNLYFGDMKQVRNLCYNFFFFLDAWCIIVQYIGLDGVNK